MGIGNFYKQPKPHKFRYVYRYYDPKKEADERRRRRIRRELGMDDEISAEDIKENIRGSFRKQSDHLSKYDDEGVSKRPFAERNRTALLILILSVALLLWLVNNAGTGMMRYIAEGFRNIGRLIGING
ncbi:MAG: hypothetical protein Q4E10_03120 [Porphyromonas sp.]|nr:hypothetical protein [Porphyromonas sp.]